jgi:hypothetical protein
MNGLELPLSSNFAVIHQFLLTILNPNPQNPKTKAITMAERKGGEIINTRAADDLKRQGEASQKAREAAMERRRKEEEEEAKAEEMKKLSQDAGTSSQTHRGKGISN